MKTVIVVTNSLTGGGAERSMNLLADSFSKISDFRTILIPINRSAKDLVEPKCQIVEIGRQWRGSLWDSLKSFVRFQVTVLKVRPDFLILNCELPELFAALSFWKGKSIIVEHTTRPWAKRKILGRLVRLILAFRSASRVKVSERISDNSRFKFQATIPNIIAPWALRDTSSEFTSGEEGKRLVFIGRLSPEKRPDLFLAVARASGLPSFFIGEGLLQESLQQDCGDLEKVQFMGYQKNPWKLVSQNDLVIITSDYEGDGLVALEAASLGHAVALRNTPDLQSIGFPDVNYFDDAAELAARLKTHGTSIFLLESSVRRRILYGRTSEKVSSKWVGFLASLS